MSNYQDDKAYKEARDAAYKAERERYNRERGRQDGIAQAKHDIRREEKESGGCIVAILFVLAILFLCWLFGSL